MGRHGRCRRRRRRSTSSTSTESFIQRLHRKPAIESDDLHLHQHVADTTTTAEGSQPRDQETRHDVVMDGNHLHQRSDDTVASKTTTAEGSQPHAQETRHDDDGNHLHQRSAATVAGQTTTEGQQTDDGGIMEDAIASGLVGPSTLTLAADSDDEPLVKKVGCLASRSNAEVSDKPEVSNVRKRQKTFDLDGRWLASSQPENVVDWSSPVPQFGQPSGSMDVFLVSIDIRGFLLKQRMASAVWSALLTEAFPEFIAYRLNVDEMLMQLVLLHRDIHRVHVQRSHLQQRSGHIVDVLECWSGSGSLTKECIRAGWRCHRLDIKHTSQHDCSTGQGLRLWLLTLCHVRRGGLLWCGTQCSSFLRMCMSKSNRRPCNGYYGDESRPFVVEGNRQMQVASLMIFVGWVLGLEFVLEQPVQSVLPLIEPLRGVLTFVGAVQVKTFLGHEDFGGDSVKPLQLWAANDKFAALARKQTRRKQPLCQHRVQPQVRLVTRLPGNKFRGNPDALKSSQVYPERFCSEVARLVGQ